MNKIFMNIKEATVPECDCQVVGKITKLEDGQTITLKKCECDMQDKTTDTETNEGLFKREEEWRMFEKVIRDHILNYTISQYGDMPDDQISDWTARDCVLAIKKRASRFILGKEVREGQDLLDCKKMAHEACIAYFKLLRGE